MSYGFNYRLSDINSALGISQLEKISFFLKKRKKIYEYYKTKLNNYKNLINFPKYNEKNKPSYHLVLISIDFKNLKKNKDDFLKYLYKNNIISQFHYIPIYNFKTFKSKKKKLKNSEEYHASTLSINLPSLKNKDQNLIIDVIKKFLSIVKINK